MLYLVFTPHFPLHVYVQSGPQQTILTIGRAPISYIPFQEVMNVGFWLNIIMTIPIGVFILLIIDRNMINLKKISIYGFSIGMSIELIQFILDNVFKTYDRFVDINDVISNMIGVVLGFYLALLIFKFVDSFFVN